jgi:pimeloyl-ACP methyl ester carboxylesterase
MASLLLRSLLWLPLAVAAPACASVSAPTPTTGAAVTSSDVVFATNGDTRIRLFTLAGKASDPPVVVVNGGPGASHQSAARLAELAQAGVRVVTFDQRGLGASSVPNDDAHYTLADQVADLDAVRRTLGVSQLTLVGHSFGGLVAMAYAAAHPDSVRALVLVSTMAPDWDDFQRANEVFETRAKALAAGGKLTEAPPPAGDDCRATSNAVLPVLFADPDYPRTHDAPEARQTQCSVHVQSATFATLPGYDVRAGLHAFRGPALVVVGAADPFGESPSRAALASLAGAKAELAVVPAAGRFPWIEGTAPFDAAVVPFLRRTSAKP